VPKIDNGAMLHSCSFKMCLSKVLNTWWEIVCGMFHCFSKHLKVITYPKYRKYICCIDPSFSEICYENIRRTR
jgi:hypothetical protein